MKKLLKNSKILIIDDKQANLDVLTGLLEIKGFYNITSTTDSRNFEKLFNQIKPDLILLDLMMPHVSGYEILEKLKKLLSPKAFLPVLVLTADLTSDSKQKALYSGASDFLTKPFDLAEVDLRINNLLKTRYLHQQLEYQNQYLDKLVRERTQKLEKANIELIIAKDKAEEMNKLKSFILANLSHELRTPIISILGFAEILQEETKIKNHLQMINYIIEGSERLNSTLSNLLELSKLEIESKDFILDERNLFNEIKEAIEPFEKSASNKKLYLRLEQSDKNVVAKIDKNLFRNALNHLIQNAIKFTQKGGITVSLSYEQKDKNLAVINIEDSGIGIEEENFEKIFEPFRQSSEGDDRNFSGIGIGLTISKKIVEILNGEIRVNSELGKGSIFSIRLPAYIKN